MKKMILPALCLSLSLTSLNSSAANISKTAYVAFENDDRQVIKSEELPAAIQKNLSSEVYKGWSVKEAARVKSAAMATATNTKATAPYYEVVLTNEKETKTVKFNEDGTLLN
jgi:Skp family chaperone for outer membrane proteins